MKGTIKQQYSQLVSKERELKNQIKKIRETLANFFKDVKEIGDLLDLYSSKQSLIFLTKRMHKLETKLIDVQLEKALMKAKKAKKSQYLLNVFGMEEIINNYNKGYENESVKVQYEHDISEPDKKLDFYFDFQ